MNKKLKKILIVVAILLACLAIIFVPPAVVHFMYVYLPAQEGIKTTFTIWSGADLLNYLAAALGLIGTFVLGVIAVWQTQKANKAADKANELNRKLVEIEVTKEMDDYCPRFTTQIISLSPKSHAVNSVIGLEYLPRETQSLSNVGTVRKTLFVIKLNNESSNEAQLYNVNLTFQGRIHNKKYTFDYHSPTTVGSLYDKSDKTFHFEYDFPTSSDWKDVCYNLSMSMLNQRCDRYFTTIRFEPHRNSEPGYAILGCDYSFFDDELHRERPL